jgi:hypothetical protein
MALREAGEKGSDSMAINSESVSNENDLQIEKDSEPGIRASLISAKNQKMVRFHLRRCDRKQQKIRASAIFRTFAFGAPSRLDRSVLLPTARHRMQRGPILRSRSLWAAISVMTLPRMRLLVVSGLGQCLRPFQKSASISFCTLLRVLPLSTPHGRAE